MPVLLRLKSEMLKMRYFRNRIAFAHIIVILHVLNDVHSQIFLNYIVSIYGRTKY